MHSLLDDGHGESTIRWILESTLRKHGRIVDRGGGMCGAVYFFDQGENVSPRWVVAKVPMVPSFDRVERNRRFLREIEIQHRTYYHRFVCWPFDYRMILDTPVALYPASNADLAQWIPRPEFSATSRLAVLVYICSALWHCRSRGVECHQDLKPQNILMRDMVKGLRDATGSDVFEFPLLADFGLANASIDFDNYQGARPYMAPEQWLHKVATGASDVFALGVIIFEVMTRGWHPYGGVTREWWPEPKEGRSKKWTRPETWEKWAKAGNPITPATFIVDGVEDIARRCMSANPADRPLPEQIAADLLAVLTRHDPHAGNQAAFQAFHADNAPHDGEWTYRDRQLDRLRHSVSEVAAAR